MNEKKFKKVIFLLLLSSFLLSPLFATAQNTKRGNARQVYLAFRYKGAVNRVITAYYKDEQFYLPVVTLLEQLGINYQLNSADLSVTGFYLNVGNKYSLYFLDQKHYAIIAGNKIKLPFKSFLVKKLDYYITPTKFEQIFSLNFGVNFNALSLHLRTDKTMPVVAALKRQRQRELIKEFSFGHEGYPLLYNRDRSWLAGGFLDYTLSANITSDADVYTYGFNLGAEVLGGDVEGQIFGSYSSNFSTFRVNNLRYHLVTDRHNPYLTQFSIGELFTEGLVSNDILGIQISNKPAVPRVLFDSYIVNGTTLPGAEVELYLNNALVGFQIADGLGNYRFQVPLTYGSSRIRVKIYGPGGQIIERPERIDIPFKFLPAGEVNYNITAGRLSNPIPSVRDSSFVVQGSVSSGLTNWLSITAGADYYGGRDQQTPVFYGALSGRFFTNYNLSAKLAPQAFYKVTGSAIYPSSVSWRLTYTYFNQEQGLYNILGLNQQIRGSLFVPFSIGAIPLNVRVFADRQLNDFQNLTRYRLSLNTRIKKLNLRFGYRNTEFGSLTFIPGRGSNFIAAATFNIARNPGIPFFLKGSFIRATADYNPYFNQFEQIELNVARQIFDEGYLQLNFAHNFIGDFNIIGFNLSFDFQKVRANASVRGIRDNLISTTTLRGSVGFDPYRNEILLMNRQQTGQAGASFRLYVDENGSGNYNRGERLITENPIRLNRASGAFTQENSVIYLSQLQAYERYDVNIDKGVIKNPLLVPAFEQFSFIADPNRYKPIDIPFFMSGVISGNVVIKRDSLKRPVSGLNIIIDETTGDFHKVLRTFSGGSFYSYEIPPGRYTLRVDSSQLSFLNAKPTPPVIEFTVEAELGGDFIEGLNFTLIPIDKKVKRGKTVGQDTAKNEVDKQREQVKKQLTKADVPLGSKGNYIVQVSAWRTKDKAMRRANVWQERGFEDTFVIKFVNYIAEKIWFRVRLGRFFTRQEVLKLKRLLKKKYQAEWWVIKIQ